MKKLIGRYITWCAKRKIQHTTAKIIAITGSVGKSSTKESITQVLKSNYSVRSNYGSLNNELGLPLAIMGEKNIHNKLGWLWRIVVMTWKTFIHDKHIDIFVLECGIDTPGDMDKILEIITPDIAVITSVDISHTENFTNFQELIKEKWKLAHGVKKNGTIVANYDNPPTHEQIPLTKDKQIITFGLNAKADMSGGNINYDIHKMQFEAREKNDSHPININIIGRAAVYTTLPAIVVGRIFAIPWQDIQESLKELKPLPGRFTPMKGINNSMLIDSSYNASPTAMKAALEVLRDLPAKRKVAIVGDMRELGAMTAQAHTDILDQLGNVCTLVIGLGPYYGEAFKKIPSHKRSQAAFHHFDDRNELIRFIIPKISEGDLVLIKGSQNTIMLEKVTAKLMAEPERAKELLPRQYGKWSKMK